MAMEGIGAMIKVVFGREGVTRDSLRRLFSLQLHDPTTIEDRVIDERLSIAALQTRRVIETMKIPDQTDELALLRCPVLGFWGADDKFCPVSGATKLATRCLDARVILLSRCGHWVMVEHTDLFNSTAIAFLDERAAP
jgi:4,5:9,10-diseco-3-hydroxy-5,9,17-trioxoandrosta-1(10),2-diene-4-oate hydrolase